MVHIIFSVKVVAHSNSLFYVGWLIKYATNHTLPIAFHQLCYTNDMQSKYKEYS